MKTINGKFGEPIMIFEYEDLEIGTLVRLKSGGPTMTVKYFSTVSHNDEVTCQWIDDSKNLHEGVFLIGQLIDPNGCTTRYSTERGT